MKQYEKDIADVRMTLIVADLTKSIAIRPHESSYYHSLLVFYCRHWTKDLELKTITCQNSSFDYRNVVWTLFNRFAIKSIVVMVQIPSV